MTPIEVLECAHLRPGDRLVLRIEAASVDQFHDVRAQITAAGFTKEQVTLVSGVDAMYVVESGGVPAEGEQ